MTRTKPSNQIDSFSTVDQLVRQRAPGRSVVRQVDVAQVLRAVPRPSRDRHLALWILQHEEHGEPPLLSGVDPGSHLHQRHQGWRIVRLIERWLK